MLCDCTVRLTGDRLQLFLASASVTPLAKPNLIYMFLMVRCNHRENMWGAHSRGSNTGASCAVLHFENVNKSRVTVRQLKSYLTFISKIKKILYLQWNFPPFDFYIWCVLSYITAVLMCLYIFKAELIWTTLHAAVWFSWRQSTSYYIFYIFYKIVACSRRHCPARSSRKLREAALFINPRGS